MTFYHYSVCHLCKKQSPNLKKCGNCKIPYYCCREHQKQDWPRHKQLCKVIVACLKIQPPPSKPSPAEYLKFKMEQSAMWSIALNRDLQPAECGMSMYQRVCAVCYSQETPIVCQSCLSVAYCSEEHHEQHKHSHEDFCETLKLCLEIDQNSVQAMDDQLITDIRTDFKELQSLPENIEEVLYSMDVKNRASDRVKLVVMSDLLSHVVNIVYALEKSGFVANRQGKKEELVIHTTRSGLRHEISVWLLFARFLSHWITNLRQVDIYWVRPGDTPRVMPFTCYGCDDCKAKNFGLEVSVFNGTYKEFVKKLPRPDLVVLFNIDNPSPLRDNNCLQVKKDMPSLIFYKRVPVLLTSFTKKDLDQVLEGLPSNVKFLVEPQLNKYRSLRPTRNFDEGSEPVYFNDHFVAIVIKE